MARAVGGQHLHREAVAIREIRRGVFARLRQRWRGARVVDKISRLLQSAAPGTRASTGRTPDEAYSGCRRSHEPMKITRGRAWSAITSGTRPSASRQTRGNTLQNNLGGTPLIFRAQAVRTSGTSSNVGCDRSNNRASRRHFSRH